MNKIGKYYAEARQRAEGKKSPWNWILFPLSVIGIIGSGFLLFKGLSDFQRHLIPTDVIYSSGIESGLLLSVPLMFLALPLGFMFANFIAWCIPPARRAMDKEAKGVKGASFKESMKPFLIWIMILLPISLPLALWGAFNYCYFTPSGVTVHPLFALKEKHYEWRDIVKIYGKFWVSGGDANREYALYMKDGRKIDLSGDYIVGFVDAYDKIKPFLKAQPSITYDYSIGNTVSYGNDYSNDRFIKLLRKKD